MRKVQPLFIKEGNEGFLFTFMITLGSSDVKYKTTNTITVPAVLRISIHYTSMALLYHLLHYNTRCIARRFSTYPTLNMLHRKKK